MGEIDPQEFGEMKGQVAAIGKVLDQHLEECAATNREVARNLNRLFIAIIVLSALVLGVDGLGKLTSLFI